VIHNAAEHYQSANINADLSSIKNVGKIVLVIGEPQKIFLNARIKLDASMKTKESFEI
jgi:hypothetical protein